VAGMRAAAVGSPRLGPKMQVNEKCRRSAIMSREIAHKHIHHVMV